MSLLLPISYFGPIEEYGLLTQNEEVTYEAKEHFVKQSYRNRCLIYGANGLLRLTVPLYLKGREKTTMDNIKISYAEKWQAQHWKAIVSSYKNSPYFDYYEQDILNIYLNEYEKLMDLNKATQDAMNKIIGISPKIKLTEEFEVSPENDYRSLIHPKKEAIVPVPRYIQVFEEKHGYIENLSILDLIFNEGPMALVYLKNLKY